MPWSPTTAFSHPLVNISHSNGERRLTNYLSYALAELMIWQGYVLPSLCRSHSHALRSLGDVINNFRRNTLGLRKLNIRNGAGVLDKLKIPCTYVFSEGLVPKPEDWRNHIGTQAHSPFYTHRFNIDCCADVAGFSFREQDSIYTPPPELIAFISEGPPPIYVKYVPPSRNCPYD